MQLVMKRISKNLSYHFKPFLNKPAPFLEILALERTIGVSLPDDLKKLYQLHNGELPSGPGLFFGMSFLPLSGLLNEWPSSHGQWIPFAVDAGGNFLAVDLEPGKNGTDGQVIYFARGENKKYAVAQSVEELIEFISKTLLEGPYTINEGEAWSYGDNGHVSLLQALKEMPLLVLHPGMETAEEEKSTGSSAEDRREETLYVDGEIIKNVFPETVHPNPAELILSGSENLGEVKSLSVSIFSYEQWEAVANASQLEHLHIHQFVGVDLPDLTLFRDLKNLQSLAIEHCAFYNLHFLTYIHNLKELTLVDCAIKDGSEFNETPIETLVLDHTSIDNLEVIAESSSLKAFAGSFQQFRSLKPKMSQPVDFSRITGGMTDHEMNLWLSSLQED